MGGGRGTGLLPYIFSLSPSPLGFSSWFFRPFSRSPGQLRRGIEHTCAHVHTAHIPQSRGRHGGQLPLSAFLPAFPCPFSPRVVRGYIREEEQGNLGGFCPSDSLHMCMRVQRLCASGGFWGVFVFCGLQVSKSIRK